jgi:hypothetical protein
VEVLSPKERIACNNIIITEVFLAGAKKVSVKVIP